MKALIPTLVLIPIFSSCASPSKSELDADVKRLCAIDGGVKVHETVRLPPEKFNEYGQINFYKPMDGQNALGTEYIFKEVSIYKNYGSASMRRDNYMIYRRSSNFLLGESVSYHRVGGDIPGPWHPSSFSCPEEAGDVRLLMKVFIKDNSGGIK